MPIPNKTTDAVIRAMLELRQSEDVAIAHAAGIDVYTARKHIEFLKKEHPEAIFFQKWQYGNIIAGIRNDARPYFEDFLSEGGYEKIKEKEEEERRKSDITNNYNNFGGYMPVNSPQSFDDSVIASPITQYTNAANDKPKPSKGGVLQIIYWIVGIMVSLTALYAFYKQVISN